MTSPFDLDTYQQIPKTPFTLITYPFTSQQDRKVFFTEAKCSVRDIRIDNNFKLDDITFINPFKTYKENGFKRPKERASTSHCQRKFGSTF